MTRPDEPGGASPARDEPTVHLSGAPDGPDQPTVRLAADEPTARLAAGDRTVHLPADHPSGEETVHLTAHDLAGDSTVHLPAGSLAADQTVPLAAGRSADEGTAPPATALRGEEPTVHLAAEATLGGTVRQRPIEVTYLDATTARTVGSAAPPTGTVAAGRGVPSGPPTTGGGEVRFGPGVPATPPSAPAWPAVARPPRPLRRRIVAAVSTLVTVALVAAVGLWLWQRLSPLEVTGVSVTVPQPAVGSCDVTVDVVATVRTNGRAGVVEYQWLRSGSPPGAVLTERVGWGRRTVTLTLKWTFSGVGDTTETATVNVVSPAPIQAGTEVRYACPRR